MYPFCNRCCEIVKLTHSSWKNGISVSAFRHLTQYVSNKNYWNKQLPLKEQGHNGFPEIKPLVIMDGCNKFCETNTVSMTVSRQLPSRKSPHPPVRIRVWFRISVKTRVKGQFSSGAIVLELSLKYRLLQALP